MDTSELTNLPVSEKLKIVTKLWDEIAESNEPIVLPPTVLSEMTRRCEAVDADPSILIDEDEMWRRVNG
jgi:putative addiction module component (TIGR02574 family)